MFPLSRVSSSPRPSSPAHPQLTIELQGWVVDVKFDVINNPAII